MGSLVAMRNMTISRLKTVLSSVAAKVLIVPVALVYVMMTAMIEIGYSDVETSIHTVADAAFWVSDWLKLSQLFIIAAPYLIDRQWIPRICASAVYASSAVVPTLYLYFYVVDGVYEFTLNPFLHESFVLFGVAVTALYLIALLIPFGDASSEAIEMKA